MGILGELSHIHGPRKANLFSQCSSGHRVAILTWLVSNGCPTGLSLEVDGRWRRWRRSQIRNLTVSYRFWPKKHRHVFRSFVRSPKKKKRNKIKRNEFIRAPFLLFSSFLFLLSLRSRKISTILLFLSFFSPPPFLLNASFNTSFNTYSTDKNRSRFVSSRKKFEKRVIKCAKDVKEKKYSIRFAEFGRAERERVWEEEKREG